MATKRKGHQRPCPVPIQTTRRREKSRFECSTLQFKLPPEDETKGEKKCLFLFCNSVEKKKEKRH